jgi:hypothetical protein
VESDVAEMRRWPHADWRDAEHRARAAAIFLVEELVLSLSEHANPRFHTMGRSFHDLVTEATMWAAVRRPP